jgi:hypothetical protein
MIGLWILWGCFNTLPQEIIESSQVPHNLTATVCSVTTKFVTQEGTQFCRDTVSEKSHGPSLSQSEDGRIFRMYEKGEEIRIPWFLDKNGVLDEKKTEAYLHHDLSLVLLKDAQRRFPNNRDISARLAEKGALNPDTLFSNKPYSCSEAVDGMICVSGGGWVQRIYDDQDTHYRTFWSNRFFVDTKLVTQSSVEACQKDCNCPEGTWNSWTVAQAYCARQGKRLLSENELWMAYGKYSSDIEIPLSRGLEWSGDDFVEGGSGASVQWNPQGKCWKDCSGHTAISINQQRQTHKSTAAFRCGVSELGLLRTQNTPRLLSQLPERRPVTQKWKSSWVYKNPKSMSKVVDVQAPNQYLSGHQVMEMLWAYHEANREVSAVYQLGKTHRDTPILALRITKEPLLEESRPSILIEGGHHGNELLSVLYVLHSIDVLLADVPRKRLEEYDFWFVPLVNPDGLEVKLFRDSGRQYGRKNGRNTDGTCIQDVKEGVDLNRNYSFKWNSSKNRGSKSDPKSGYYRGEEAASEPEVQAMMALAEQQYFVASLSFHTPGTSILVPYTASRTKSPQPNIAWDVAEQLSKKSGVLHNERKYAVRNRRFYAEGTFQDWLFHRFGTMAFLIEGTEHNPETIPKIRSSVRAIKRLLPSLLEALETRPVLEGFIVDKKGTPISASVEIRGYALREGEIWKSRPSDGYFHRLLFDHGSYEVIVHADGYETLHQNCTVQKDRIPCQLVLQSIF